MDVFDDFFLFGWEANRKQWDGPPIEHGPEYSLSVIEFDDQGWYQDMEQREALMNFLDETANEDLLIVVFIHGWKHNAASADGNLRSFRALLRDARASEAQRAISRRVLGVYQVGAAAAFMETGCGLTRRSGPARALRSELQLVQFARF